MVKLRDWMLRWLDVPVLIPSEVSSGHEVVASVDGASLRFSCERKVLTLSPEALGTAFLLPAVAKGRRLAGSDVDPVWFEGVRHVQRLAGQWWGWHAGAAQFCPGEMHGRLPGVGLAFSLGVDSFYSLFFADPAPDLLVLASGFDVPLEEYGILAAMRNSVAEVASITGKDWVVIETDIRKHPLFRSISWERSHGSAIAVLGHLLSQHIGTMLISSWGTQSQMSPWGSHPELDRGWSSGRLLVKHVGDETSRPEKVVRLVNHPVAGGLIRRHLRVCWKQPSVAGNCGYCEKCVRLRLTLHRHAPDFVLETMPQDLPLADAIASLPPLRGQSPKFFRELAGGTDARVEAAIRNLLRHSEIKTSHEK